jgi:hypothetical protein
MLNQMRTVLSRELIADGSIYFSIFLFRDGSSCFSSSIMVPLIQETGDIPLIIAVVRSSGEVFLEVISFFAGGITVEFCRFRNLQMLFWL